MKHVSCGWERMTTGERSREMKRRQKVAAKNREARKWHEVALEDPEEPVETKKPKRELSAKGRKAISDAQKQRWAENKAQRQTTPKGVVPIVEEVRAEAILNLVKSLGKSGDYLSGYIDGWTEGRKQ